MSNEITLAALAYADNWADPTSLLHRQKTASFIAGAIWANEQRDAEANALRENLADLRDATLFELQRANRLEKQVNALRELHADVYAQLNSRSQ